ncbi:MAG: hypothetical protein KatS3mg103_0016 [Phycisphaerales bacterium]|nr:MAG: hypothetical protein KatS3mg103_0016 [Phycisphaerales bacterium]
MLYTHLVVNDYLAQQLPEKMVVSPADVHRLNWQKEPQGAVRHQLLVAIPRAGDRVQQALAVQLQLPGRAGVPTDASREGARITQATHRSYFVPGNCKIGGLRITAVDSPSQKVFMHDNVDRYSRIQLYHAFPDAKVCLLMFDGSASQRVTDDANEGWQLQQPAFSDADALLLHRRLGVGTAGSRPGDGHRLLPLGPVAA